MNIFTQCKFSLLFVLSLFLGLSAYAQEQSVSGTITDAETGEALPGVNVLVKGTSQGTVTDIEGQYKLNVPGSESVLVFSSIGYATQEVAVGSQSNINISISPDIQALSEIVVTGYSTENRREVTGAVATVSSEELTAIPSGNVEQQLQGRVGGVTVITNGQPGTSSVVRVRGFGSFGNNEPLYVVDGVPVGSTDFLAPDDIESTTVLKDAASASIYGARAASGVIVYTTKKGKRDGTMKVRYDGVFGYTFPGKVNNILNPQEQADAVWLAKRNTATQLGIAPGSEAYLDLFKSDQYGSDPSNPVLPDYLMVGNQFGVVGDIDLEAQRALYNVDRSKGDIYLVMRANKAGTNWFDAITNPAPLNRHMLSFSGGNDRSTYYLSLGMQDQNGIILNQNFTRYSLRLNSEHDVTKKFRIGENIQATYLSVTGLIGGAGGRGAAAEENDFLSAFRMPAIIPVYNEFGGYAGTQAKGFNNPRNPVAARERSKDNYGFGFGIFGNVYAELDLLENLKVRSSFGGSLGLNYSNYYNRTSYENSENNSTFSYGENSGYNRNWIFTNTAEYKKQFGVHDITLLGGIESLNVGYFRQMSGNGQEPFSRDIDYITLTNTTNRVVNSDFRRGVNFFSVFGQARYTYNDKYMLNALVRRDGSSRFGANNRYGIFPAVSAAWRISDEGFMSGVSFVSDLKIRGGWGQMGNSNNVDPYNQYSLFASNLSQSYYDIAGANGTPAEGFYRSRIGNPNAKWETAETSNIGFDGSFFDGKLDLIFDLWRKDTKDLLYELETPAVVGAQAADPALNIASIRNQGIDLEIVTRGNASPTLRYEVKVTGSFLQNEITSIAPDVPYFDSPITFRGINPIRNQVGYAISSFYGYQVAGLFQNQADIDNAATQDGVTKTEAATADSPAGGIGRFKYADINGDGAITPDDRTYLGDPVPDFNGGINIKLNYKNFELETFFQTFLGVDIFNQSRWFTDFYPSFTGAAYGRRVQESFTFENGGNTTPIFENVSNFSTNTQSNSYYVESGNYGRLANLQLAYNLPEGILSRYGMDKVRVYLQATNLFTITSYEGLDPGVAGDADTRLGIDVGNPPVTRGYNIGLNIGF